ncbi:Tricalbin-2 [Entomophthora muscae]|uniref:Tricalbin-2 n=1 Tax=Entomophthora muscae TaxID=34485 RepID=A0ACC2UC13_9FUNG|nr:Tricalbin-2 [Entomophthora muscae]
MSQPTPVPGNDVKNVLADGFVHNEPDSAQVESSQPAAIAKDKIESQIASGGSKPSVQIIDNVVSTTDPNPSSSQAMGDAAQDSLRNEPLIHVTLEDQAKPGFFERDPGSSSGPGEVDLSEPCIGWDQLAERNVKTNNAIVQGQVSHWRNVTVIYSAVILTWLGVVLGGGFSWCLLIIGCCSTYYMNTVERYRRAARDDAIRELWLQKLEDEEESVGWLNNFLDRFWVIYEPGLSATIKSVVDSVLEVSTPPFLESLSLTTFQLGNKAPRIHAVKTYPKTEIDTVLMDWDIEFQPNYDPEMTQRQISNQITPKVILQIRVGKGFVGAGMPILVENFALKGKMRVRINFGSQFPHISVVGLQFLDRPSIDYVLKPVGGDTFGIDIAHIPGLSTLISDQIHAILTPMMYQPNEFILNVGDILNPVQINQVAGILRVNVRYARDLKYKDGSGDPFVEISGSTKFQNVRTKVVRSTNRPDWNEVHSIMVYKDNENLKFTVTDYNPILKNIECGTALLPLDSFSTKKVQNGLTLSLQREQLYVGSLTLDCSFFPTTSESQPDKAGVIPEPKGAGVLRFTLHQIKDLDASKSLIGKYTPYAYLLVNGVEMHQTMKKKRTNSPVYEESVDCVITDIKATSLALTIMDDKGMASDPVVAQWTMPATKVIQGSGWYSLNNVASGKVKVTAAWYPVEMESSKSLLPNAPSNYFGIAEIYLMEALQLKLLSARNEVSVKVTVSDAYRSTTTRLRGDAIPRWNQAFYVPVLSPTDIIHLQVIEHSASENILVGSIEHSVLQLVNNTEDGYKSKGLINFWTPLVTKLERVQGLLHFGSCFHIASLPSAVVLVPTSCIISFTIHGARKLPPGNMGAAVFISGKAPRLIVETPLRCDTSTPKWDTTGNVFISDSKKETFSIVIQDQKASGLGRWEMLAHDLLKQQDGSRIWVPLGNDAEVELSFSVQEVAYEEYKDMNKLLTCGRLEVDIVRAVNLIGVDSSGTSDPFIKARLNGTRVFKSQVIKKNLNPVFNERFSVPILDINDSYLMLEVFDWNKINASEKLGKVTIPLSSLNMTSSVDKLYPLDGSSRGELQVKLAYSSAVLSDDELAQAALHRAGANAPFPRHGTRQSIHSLQSSFIDRNSTSNSVLTVVSIDQILEEAASGAISAFRSEATGREGKLEIRIISAEKLVGADRNGTSDPYLKIKHDGKVLFQTKTISKDCNPIWNETFTTDLNDGSPYYLHLSVMDYNRINAHSNIGDICFNIWDHINANDSASYQSTFWTRELNGGSLDGYS